MEKEKEKVGDYNFFMFQGIQIKNVINLCYQVQLFFKYLWDNIYSKSYLYSM